MTELAESSTSYGGAVLLILILLVVLVLFWRLVWMRGGVMLATTREKYDDPPQQGEDRPPTIYGTETKGDVRLGIDITRCPEDWIPKGMNYAVFTARVLECDPARGWVPSTVGKKITFELKDVTREKGVCLNYGESTNYDLFFPKDDASNKEKDFTFFIGSEYDVNCEKEILGRPNFPGHKHYQKVVTKDPVVQIAVVVRSEDYGACGWIEASFEGCERVPSRKDAASAVECPPNTCCTTADPRKYRAQIPIDANDNHIADCAAQDSCGQGEQNARKDEDDSPRGTGPGDGLTAYEEYRGFIVERKANGDWEKTHVRTDLGQKDLFVYVEDKDFRDHLDLFRNASGLEVHVISDPKFVKDVATRQINFNHGYAHGGIQHALWLRNNGALKGYGKGCQKGAAVQTWEGDEPADEAPGTPGTRDHICVNKAKCLKDGGYRLGQVMAHELGHGIGIFHHGEKGRHKFTVAGKEVYYFHQRTLTSGDPTCIMRYDHLGDGWCEEGGTHARHRTYIDATGKSRINGPGTVFCDDTRGYGVNWDNGVSNDAAPGRGNCRSQIRVKDW